VQAICDTVYFCAVSEDTYDDLSTTLQNDLQLQMKAATVDTSNAHDRDFDNPLYAEPVGKDPVIESKTGNQVQSPSKLLFVF
jgi:hypothetical protein